MTYLLIGNGGGLAALLAIYPAVHDVNHIWLGQQLLVAMSFSVGAALGFLAGTMGYLNFFLIAHLRFSIANLNELWIKEAEFGTDRQ